MKLSQKDALAILRLYKLADDTNIPKQISSIRSFHPIPTNTVVSFCFLNNQYFALFDDTADDDKDYAARQIMSVDANSNISLLDNPNRDNKNSFSIPFKAKACYLFSVIASKKRLDIELFSRYPDTSRNLWQKHIKAGYVSVNGTVAKAANTRVSSIDKISINLPITEDYSQNTLPIIFIDDNVIVVNKPIGILSHAKGKTSNEFSVADFFSKYTDFNATTNRPGIVHRLDRDTSGVIIGARNNETGAMLQKQFSNRKVQKTYLAIVEGRPKHDEAIIDLPIGRNPSKPSTFRIDASGKKSITKYKVLASNDKYSLIKLEPKTGRTHQLRVHLRYINTPILGDKVYGSCSDRLYLHAYSLEITIPTSDRQTFIAPIPEAFYKHFKDISL